MAEENGEGDEEDEEQWTEEEMRLWEKGITTTGSTTVSSINEWQQAHEATGKGQHTIYVIGNIHYILIDIPMCIYV